MLKLVTDIKYKSGIDTETRKKYCHRNYILQKIITDEKIDNLKVIEIDGALGNILIINKVIIWATIKYIKIDTARIHIKDIIKDKISYTEVIETTQDKVVYFVDDVINFKKSIKVEDTEGNTQEVTPEIIKVATEEEALKAAEIRYELPVIDEYIKNKAKHLDKQLHDAYDKVKENMVHLPEMAKVMIEVKEFIDTLDDTHKATEEVYYLKNIYDIVMNKLDVIIYEYKNDLSFEIGRLKAITKEGDIRYDDIVVKGIYRIQSKVLEIEVDKGYAGYIIGKKGSNLKRIKDNIGIDVVRVNVKERDTVSEKTIRYLTGQDIAKVIFRVRRFGTYIAEMLDGYVKVKEVFKTFSQDQIQQIFAAYKG